MPHPPQCAALEERFVSQPFVLSPSQLPKPAVHASPQRPAAQTPVALKPPGQTFPQAPQWVEVPSVLVSHPFAAPRSQSAKPGLQSSTAQAPAVQTEVPFVTVHARPHCPQWARSVCTRRH